MLAKLLKPIRKRFGANRQFYKIIDDIFGISPNNIELYKLALVHRSASVLLPGGSLMNNERLEFLGDAVIECAVSEYLFVEFPDRDEGFLTQLRSKIVSRQSLNELCHSIGLAPHIVSNAGGGFIQKHIFGDAIEAMMGAIYLDKGYDTANRIFIEKMLGQLDMSEITVTETDFKSRLIEWCQKSKHTIHFETDYAEGSTAHNPIFKSVAFIDELEVGYGMGDSKKQAEQMASYAVSQALSDNAGDNLLDMFDYMKMKPENDGEQAEGN